MQNDKPVATGIYWRYGLIGGLIVIAITLIQNIAGFEESPVLGIIFPVINLAVLGTVIFLGIKSHRDNINDGVIGTGRAFATGFFIAAIVGLISAVYTFIYYQFIDPNFMQEMLDRTTAQMEDQGMSEEDLENAVYFMRLMMTPAATAVMALVWNIFFGLILSLISALILNRQEEDTA